MRYKIDNIQQYEWVLITFNYAVKYKNIKICVCMQTCVCILHIYNYKVTHNVVYVCVCTVVALDNE